MDPSKRKSLEEAGWVFGDADDFLNTAGGLGGEDRQVAPEVVRSSRTQPNWPTTESKKVLRYMLKSRDTQLSVWDKADHNYRLFMDAFSNNSYRKLDNERRLIRLRLKSLGRKI